MVNEMHYQENTLFDLDLNSIDTDAIHKSRGGTGGPDTPPPWKMTKIEGS